MNTFHSLAELADFGPTVTTIGNFDGVHRGHRWVIDQLNTRARALGSKSLAITFEPHPARVLRPDTPHTLITPLLQKLDLLADTGLDATLVLPFTEALSRLTPEAFVTEILRDGAHAREVHEGQNFRFGYRAAAGVDELATLGLALGFEVETYTSYFLRGAPVSSSRIRTLIAAGEVSEARALLGRPFALRSTPAPGRGFGTRYTVPTINLTPYPELIPAHGVYITSLTVGSGPAAECFEAVTNVGVRPTFGADSFTIESHLLNFHPIALAEDTPLELSFLHRLRPERRFASPELLREQIMRDVAKAKRFFYLWKSIS